MKEDHMLLQKDFMDSSFDHKLTKEGWSFSKSLKLNLVITGHKYRIQIRWIDF